MSAAVLPLLWISTPVSLLAQGARVVITVFQAIPGVSTIPAVGAAVCFTSTNNTRLTNGSGQVTFDNIPAGQWSAVIWKSGFRARRSDITVPTGATIVPNIVTLSDRSSEASPCILPTVARLGEEVFPERGQAPTASADGKRTLDCKQFGASAVISGITGKSSEGVNQLKLVCQTIRSDGTLNPLLQFTNAWLDNSTDGTAFGRNCPTGFVMTGMQTTAHATSGQVRSITIQCRQIGRDGLTAGSTVVLAPAGTPTTRTLLADRCSDGRPARAIRAVSDLSQPNVSSLFAPWIIATTQLFCEQPVVP
jgi:hypothetical protein